MALTVTSGEFGQVALTNAHQLLASRCSIWAGSPGPMYMTCAVLSQYDPQIGSSTASATCAYSSLSRTSKNAGVSRARLENRIVFDPTKFFPSSPSPWVAPPGCTPWANSSAAARI